MFKGGGFWIVQCVLIGVFFTSTPPSVNAESGCSNYAQDAGFPDSQMSACKGQWAGHVKFADNLCATGWHVCNWQDDAHTLAKIPWNVALSVDGCFAYNAAQDGGRCRECSNQLDKDDMAGIGRDCPHQNKGQTSCINGGRIDASCCVDSHISLNRGCMQQSWIDGVMCCKRSGQKPRVITPPPERMDITIGRIFMLSCQADGVPAPRIQWYKDGSKVEGGSNSRVAVFPSGDLLVTVARKSDSGQYSCEAINEEGIDIAHTQVFVKEHESGCEDGSTEGLSMHQNIHACAGKWKGHVKNGNTLCARGWHVCNSHDQSLLQDLSWLDIFDVKGCYAYNVANTKSGKCRRCHTGKGRLAGIGQTCKKVNYGRPSCLANGRIDVYKTKDKVPREESCSYQEGLTSGVLCCKRPNKRHKKKKEKSHPDRPHCSLGCENGGQCVGYNVCMCPVGYKGAMCQNAVCHGGCGSRAKCVRPGQCECIHPYKGDDCSEKELTCKSPCLNGGRCVKGKCKCQPTHYGSSCQHLYKHLYLSHLNRTER